MFLINDEQACLEVNFITNNIVGSCIYEQCHVEDKGFDNAARVVENPLLLNIITSNTFSAAKAIRNHVSNAVTINDAARIVIVV